MMQPGPDGLQHATTGCSAAETGAPIVGTGIEEKVARDSGAMVISETDGVVQFVDAEKIVIAFDADEQIQIEKGLLADKQQFITYELIKFQRTNQDTCINQRPLVNIGERVSKGQVIADGGGTDNGELALGRNILVAFMPWLGYNFEDAIIVSERIVREDLFTSVHIQEFELQVRDTKRGKKN